MPVAPSRRPPALDGDDSTVYLRRVVMVRVGGTSTGAYSGLERLIGMRLQQNDENTGFRRDLT